MKSLAVAYVCLAVSLPSFWGCATGGGQLSENFALEEFGAKATDSRMNDGNINTFATTSFYQAESRSKEAQEQSDDYTEASVTLPRAREINRIVVIGDELERFDVEIHLADEGWKVIREIKGNKKRKFGFNTSVVADVVRVRVPRLYESREIGGQRRVRKVGSRESGEGRVGEKKIYEIELYSKIAAASAESKPGSK